MTLLDATVDRPTGIEDCVTYRCLIQCHYLVVRSWILRAAITLYSMPTTTRSGIGRRGARLGVQEISQHLARCSGIGRPWLAARCPTMQRRLQDDAN